MKRYIITGGPGVGKTTLLDALQKKGFKTVPEDARAIIREQMISGGEGLPWKNKALYAQLMLEASLKSYKKVIGKSSANTVFFDRGIPDTICYMKMEKIPIADETVLLIQAHPYDKKVFMLPPWEEIYMTDLERKQTWKEAVVTYEEMTKTYTELGYELIIIPKDTIEKRVEFILNVV